MASATASVGKTVAGATDAVQVGVKNVAKPEMLATVGGFAASRVVEVALYSNFRGVFGDSGAAGGLTAPQKTARTVAKAAGAILAAGVLIPNRNKIASGAGVGLAAGLLWHVLNDFGVNV